LDAGQARELFDHRIDLLRVLWKPDDLYELFEQAVFTCLDALHLQKFKAPVVVRYLEIYLVATGSARRYAGSLQDLVNRVIGIRKI
jgi:hypothetical protein